MNDNATTLDELKRLVIKFRQERGWDEHFTPKNVATSISIEAAELLEHYQWDKLIKEDAQAITDELADVLIFAFHFATLYDIDIATAFKAKLERAAQKYPTEIFNPESSADTTDVYHDIKKRYRSQKGNA